MKKYIIGLVILFTIIITSTVKANPSYFLSSFQNDNFSTTTYRYLIAPGVGTSTNTLNTGIDNGFALNTDGAFLIQISATSTTATPQPPIVKIRFQYSQDGADWYGLSNPLASNATNTPYTGSFGEIQIAFASSTDLISTTGTTTRVAQLIPVKLYTRFIRAEVVSGGGSSAVWTQFVATKENR